MRVALGSIFRNSTPYLDRYFGLVGELQELLDRKRVGLTLLLVEGDSTDNTWNELARRMESSFDGMLIKRSHHGPMWGSVDVPERWKALAWCCNGVMDMVTDEDALIYVESDLLWKPETMIDLLGHLYEGYHAVAPMSMHSSGRFYDIWGHVKNGKQFEFDPPYHPDLDGTRMVEVDSAGSCVVMQGRVARVSRFGSTDCIRGLGRSIRANGFSLWLDTNSFVVHP